MVFGAFMIKTNASKISVRIHLTNVSGIGAIQLLQSLLPSLEREEKHKITDIYLPNRGSLVKYHPLNIETRTMTYQRMLPNALSRFLECVVFSKKIESKTPLLVLGDLPLRNNSPQTVFIQTPHLFKNKKFTWNYTALKFLILRYVFTLNRRYAKNFIVQTNVMRDSLVGSYPDLKGKVFVIQQPVPDWLLDEGCKRKKSIERGDGKLKLIYPAASYAHKNHKLLSKIIPETENKWPVEKLTLTIESNLNPAKKIPWVHCVGLLSPQEMIKSYSEVDAMLMLSINESYGFPLVEAMFIGIPIICPKLSYAITLCGDQAIYFEPEDIDSLKEAVNTLYKRIVDGWWPDWSKQLETIPSDWNSVARNMLEVVDGKFNHEKVDLT